MTKTVLFKKNVILGVGGGIAAYKSVDLLRQLVKLGANVQVIMTKNATEFVGPITFETVSSNRVLLNLFKNQHGKGITHINLAETADAVILAPATANIIGKIANGIADDALSTLILAVTSPIMVCPSMNSNMYENPATQRNLDSLIKNGYFVLPPDEGELACGVKGPGRLPEPSLIIDRLISFLTPNDMDSKQILVTAGPTQEFIDPVRFISNPSSGRMGYALARTAENRGAYVTLISGPVSIMPPANVNFVSVQSASQMAEETFRYFDTSDVIIKVAAVSDYKPKRFLPYKIKKKSKNITLDLEKTFDILEYLGHKSRKNQIIVGFAAETCDILLNARKKLKNKKLDMVVANFIGAHDSGFSSNNNQVSIFFSNGGMEDIPLMSKDSLAHILLNHIARISKMKQEG